jgi:signal transduction histidine kinase
MQAVEMIPSARRLITSLHDMGYDFSQAVADVVDNSIEAKATLVAIDVVFDGDDSWLRISDNGVGMTPEELREAMRYVPDRDYNEDDLYQCEVEEAAKR